jgi:hypothetical protein
MKFMLQMFSLNSIIHLSFFTISPPVFVPFFCLGAVTYSFHVEAEQRSAGCKARHLHEQTLLAGSNEKEVKDLLFTARYSLHLQVQYIKKAKGVGLMVHFIFSQLLKLTGLRR